MKTKTYISRILWYQGIGFTINIFFLWFIEFFDSPIESATGEMIFNWHECLIESFLIVVVAIPVMLFTKKLLSRLYYLEGFLRVCAWCKKLEHNNEWIPIETYFKEQFKTESSHGICPECFEQARQKMQKAAAS